MLKRSITRAITLCAVVLLSTHAAQADFTIQFSESDFDSVTPDFSMVSTFAFEIRVAENFAPGTFNNPTITSVDYSVSGTLANGTPSGFPGFALVRSMDGTEFYGQGSSLNFMIAAGVDLSDGLQVSELSGSDPVFVFNGREENTGRFHPALFVLNSDGTGQIQNSNNTGAGPNRDIDVGFGEEYVTNVQFNPNTFTVATVPEPSTSVMLAVAGVGMLIRRRR